ncbi:MAG: lysoplasmalogenase [Actinomycetota bacterium]|nr:lysoplasmalogenase [Actinomycetota bacterium]
MLVLLPALVLAAADWVAVATGARRAEYFLKPAVLLAILGAAIAIGADASTTESRFALDTHTWFLVLVALSLSLLGDVFLMLPSDRFVPGLVAFLGAHICYVAAFAWPGLGPGLWMSMALVGVTSTVLFGRIRAGIEARGRRELVVPVLVYVMAISVMVVVAVGTSWRDDWPQAAATSASVGAVLFYASDGLIGWTRFVSALRHGRIAIMITYHLGQMGLVLSLSR